MPKVRIVIPTFNNALLTIQCVTALRADPAWDTGDWHIVYVDNGSTDETLAWLRADTDQKGSRTSLVRNKTPRAYSKSLNMGASLPGEYDVLVLLNNDTIVAPGAIDALVGALNQQSQVALAFSPQCVAKAGLTPPKLAKPKTLEDVYGNVEAVGTWWERHAGTFSGLGFVGDPYVKEGGYAFAVTKYFWRALGGFDERYDLFGGDYDFFARARRHTKMVKVRAAFIDHLEHQSVAWLGLEREVRMAHGRFLLHEDHHAEMELVSVVIPVYNRVEALEAAIDSVLAQRMPHWRIYVVDDGSPDWDRVQALAHRKYGHLHGKLWFFHLPENRGPGGARNFGCQASRGKYVAFLDSDDVWYPDHLEKHVGQHERSHCLMSYSRTGFAWRWWDEGVKGWQWRVGKHPEQQLKDWSHDPMRLERECYIKTSTVVVWGDMVRGGGFMFPDPTGHRDPHAPAEDWEFFKAVNKVGGIAFIDHETGRTHWAKRATEDGHHSARLNPFADFEGLPEPPGELCQQCLLTEPALGVVIPTLGRPAELRRAVDSLPPDVEKVVVVDGDSGMASAQCVVGRPDVSIVTYPERKGPSGARNAGIYYLLAPVCWYLDDDDVALPGAPALVLETMETHGAAVFDLLMECTTGHRQTSGEEWYTSGLAGRTAALRQVPFDEARTHAEERDYAERLGRHCEITRVAQPVAFKTTGAFRASPMARRVPLQLPPGAGTPRGTHK